MSQSPFEIALVGCGPNGTYALERLCVLAKRSAKPMKIHVFERTGDFGAGWVHSPHQKGPTPRLCDVAASFWNHPSAAFLPTSNGS